MGRLAVDHESTGAGNKGMTDYTAWFERITGDSPYSWQASLGEDAACADRVLRIPTGFGNPLCQREVRQLLLVI